MKFQKLICTLIIAASLGMAQAKVEWVDRIAVIVNQDVITERDISDMSNNLKSTLPKGEKPSAEALRQAAVDQLIDKKLVLQIAQLNNITASDAEIDQMVEQIAQGQGISTEQVYAAIAKEGVPREVLRKTIAENIVVSKITQQEIAASSQATNEEVARFLAQYPQAPVITVYDVQHILLKTDQRSDKQARNELLKLRTQLQKGASFERVAAQYSQDTASAANGGRIGWVSQGMSTPEFDQALQSLNVGEISRPIKSGFGWHILRINDTRQEAMSAEQRVAAARAVIAEQKAPQAYQAWLQHLRSTAYIDFRQKPY
ncbi:MAG: peptidylprolyl isomerase [Neisseria sp.]|nr:peptidylprolyl isomerase [Neisseria sp.]